MTRNIDELLSESDDNIGMALADKRLLTLQHYRMLEKVRPIILKVLRDRRNHARAQEQTDLMFGESE